uniref:Uncharacterized protein n=1 Tax=Athene cunicularia TaxID=194338 RepID=A0A663LTQ6_ATHCN
MVVAQLGQGTAAEEVAGYHRGLFDNALEDHSGEQVSGLLLLYSSCIFHVVEVRWNSLFPHRALLQEIKVLVVAHNIPTRLFPDWHVATATPPATRPRAPTPAQSTAEVVADPVLLLKLYWNTLFVIQDDSEDTNENVHTLAPELLIPAETINYLCNAEEWASPEDFLRIYLSPSQPALDSETVWPVPSHFSV